jgi:hypothetical protein
LTLQQPALTIVGMDSSRGPPLEELTKAGIAYDKHPEAGQ